MPEELSLFLADDTPLEAPPIGKVAANLRSEHVLHDVLVLDGRRPPLRRGGGGDGNGGGHERLLLLRLVLLAEERHLERLAQFHRPTLMHFPGNPSVTAAAGSQQGTTQQQHSLRQVH